MEVQRILHQRALDVKLDPELQRRCMTDLGKWCSGKTEAGQELECLQDHLEDLAADCREVVGNLTELESEVTGPEGGRGGQRGHLGELVSLLSGYSDRGAAHESL